MSTEEKSIYQELVEANVPIDSHASDLYAKVTPESTKIVENHKHVQGRIVKTFINQIDGELWYDIPFAYDPWWEAKQRR